MNDVNITARCRYGRPDDECLPLTQCICGAIYPDWTLTLGLDREDAESMPCCGVRLYWVQTITIIAVEEDEDG